MDLKLLECIQFSLNHHLVSNAIFLAERLYAFHKNENTLNILAECYYRAGKVGKAYHLLVNTKDSSNKYLFAVCCYDLEKWGEGIQVLTTESVTPGGAAGLHLLGMLCRRSNQNSRATNYFHLALEKNPFLWCAFESLCSSHGSNNLASEFTVESSKYYGEPNAVQLNYLMEQSDQLFSIHNVGSLINQNFNNNNFNLTNNNNFNLSNNNNNNNNISNGVNNFNLNLNLSNLSTSTNSPFTPVSTRSVKTVEGNDSMDTESTDNFSTPVPNKEISTPQTPSPLITKTMQAPKKKTAIETKAPTTKISARGSLFPSEMGSPVMAGLAPNPTRRSSRLSDHEKKKTVPAPEKKRVNLTKIPISPSTPLSSFPPSNQSNVQISVVQPSTAIQTQTFITTQNANVLFKPNNNIKEELGTPCLLALLSQIGYAYLLNRKYHCRDAIKEFESLPLSQYNTSFIQDQIARAHYEVGEYNEAHEIFEKLIHSDPYRAEGLELYSTMLWLMKRESELSSLALHLIEKDKMVPQVWIAVGNCFSLQREHTTALKMFQRALQLDPYFTYVHTLIGHEYIAQDDLDKALASFRHALLIDPNHYKAWYGLGLIYYKQEKLALAEYHFVKAHSLNPFSSTLACYVGMVLHANGKSEESLSLFEHSLKLNPRDTIARFEKAKVLFSLNKYEESLNELKDLSATSPRESQVLLLMGKVYKSLGDTNKAMSCYTTALDLDPKGSSNVKVLMDNLYIADEIDEDAFEL